MIIIFYKFRFKKSNGIRNKDVKIRIKEILKNMIYFKIFIYLINFNYLEIDIINNEYAYIIRFMNL